MTTLALFLRYWREGVIVGVLLFGVLMCRARDAALVAQGAAEASGRFLAQQLHVSDSTLAARDAAVRGAVAAQRVAEAQRDSATSRARAQIAEWQRIAQAATTRAVVTPTAAAADTVSTIPTLPTVIQAGNALAARCSQVITDCDAERAGAHATIAALTADRAALLDRVGLLEQRSTPPPRSCTPAFTAGALLGFGGGLLTGENLRIPLLTLHR